MGGQFKPIETYYNGYKFRSRLEARWAVFFDALRMGYKYEPEGFKGVNDIPYLPDFYLPASKTYVEVKGSDESLDNDAEKISAAIDCQSTPLSKSGLLILGDIPNPERVSFGNIPMFKHLKWDRGVASEHAIFAAYGDELKECGPGRLIIGDKDIIDFLFKFSDTYCSDYPEIPCDVSVECEWTLDNIRSYKFTRLKKAFACARQAQFEHGSSPKFN